MLNIIKAKHKCDWSRDTSLYLQSIIIIIIIIIIIKKRLVMQNWERAINAVTVRRSQPHNTNP